MIQSTTCNKCGSLLQYDSSVTHEGLRDFEEVTCPVCGNVVDTVFTNLLPVVTVIRSHQ